MLNVLEAAHLAASLAVQAEVAARPEDLNALDCGFAWVVVDGTSPLARFCRARLKQETDRTARARASRTLGDKGYPTGWQFWKPGDFPGQSVRVHRVGAEAFAAKLAEFGISATVGSRLD